MLKQFKIALVSLLIMSCFYATKAQSDYQKGWQHLSNSERETAMATFKKALNDPATATDAALTLMLLSNFNGREEEGQQFWQRIAKTVDNPYAYIYTYWYYACMAGTSYQKSPEQEKMLQELLADAKAPSMIKAAANYTLTKHAFSKEKFKQMHEYGAACTNMTEWQFVGPFDNVSGSGFDKQYAPIRHPQNDTVFKSVTNADIHWFTPFEGSKEGWTVVEHYIPWRTAVIFAQTFVQSPNDREAILGFGMSGNAKIWVNDKLVFSHLEECRTDYDVFKVPVQLKQGNNRVLVQLGYENASYPYFGLRFLDSKQQQLMTDLVSHSAYAAYPKDVNEEMPTPIPFFAEAYFETKLQKDPDNLLNYILLSEAYLRSSKKQQALAVIEKAVEKAPNNLLIRYQRLVCFMRTDNRTGLTEEVAKIRELDEEAHVSLNVKFNEELRNEKYEEAQVISDRMVELYGEDEEALQRQLQIYSYQKKVEDLVKTAEKAYQKYPLNENFATIKYRIVLSQYKNPTAAMAIYEQFLKKDFNVGIVAKLRDDYFEQGLNSKGLALIKKLHQAFPYDPDYLVKLYRYHYDKKENEEAKSYVDKILKLSPFDDDNWAFAAQLSEQMEDKKAALKNYQQALHFNQNNYTARRRIRELEQKTNLETVFPKIDYYNLLKKAKPEGKKAEYNWYFVYRETNTVVHPERNAEVWHTMLVKVLTDKGISIWKEHNIYYNGYRERLVIEKAEVVKANGTKVTAEKNDGHLVFPNLQTGDAVLIKYKTVSYSQGRMSREFWDSYYFNMYIPIDASHYRLLIHKDIPLEIRPHNFEGKPTIKDIEDYKLYTWEVTNEPALEEEPNDPKLVDIGKMIHVSTISNWKTITEWYGNVSGSQAKQDYEVKKLVETLFPNDKKYTELEKAKVIYEWIIKNIRYSSVSFRQGGYIPQRAVKVIQTRLGDCKDLATLYAAMAREVGMKAQLVLVNTRDNGEKSMLLPSMDFNHCIVKVVADGQTYFLELTDPNLPFGALPNGDYKSLVLEIPYKDLAGSDLFVLDPPNRKKDFKISKCEVTIQNRDLVIDATIMRGGDLASDTRNRYQNMLKNKQIEGVQKSIANAFTNTVTIKDLNFVDLDKLTDTASWRVKYQVRNEVVEMGSLNTVKVPYYHIFIKADGFPQEARTVPLNYWEYEDCEQYQDEILMRLPEGKSFTDVPKNVQLSFKETQYALAFEQKSPNMLLVKRTIRVDRSAILPSEYEQFKKFVDEVLSAEAKFLVFK